MKRKNLNQKNMKRNRWKRSWDAPIMAAILLVAIAFTGCQTTEPDPAQLKSSVPVGTWIDSQKVAEKDGKTHPITYRIDSISRDGDEVAAAIEAYNLSGAGSMIGKLDNDNLEFCLVNYSVKFPKDFPQSGFGITDVAIPFDIVPAAGDKIQVGDVIYQNLGETWEIGDLPQGYDFHAGDTYHGQIVFIMVKGYTEYLIHEIKESADEADHVYIKGE
jgi:hypothetical protein